MRSSSLNSCWLLFCLKNHLQPKRESGLRSQLLMKIIHSQNKQQQVLVQTPYKKKDISKRIKIHEHECTKLNNSRTIKMLKLYSALQKCSQEINSEA